MPTADGDMPAYRAMPASGGPFPMVLVIQEVFGVHEHIKDLCRRFAKAGYYAIAPALYARQGDPSKYTDIPKLISEVVVKVPTDEVMSDLDAAVIYAKSTGKADTKRLAVTGWCWGGYATWMYAAHNPALQGGRRVLRRRPQDQRPDPAKPGRHRRRPQMPAARLLRRAGQEHPAGDDRKARRSAASPARPARSRFTRTPSTASTPITGRATTPTRPRTPGTCTLAWFKEHGAA